MTAPDAQAEDELSVSTHRIQEGTHCEFCSELSRDIVGQDTVTCSTGMKLLSRTIAYNDAYVAIVSVGPIVRGHCLIIPRQHQLSMSEVAPGESSDLFSLLASVRGRLAKCYSHPTILFEHGAPAGSDARPCSVGHAHWHLAPSALPPEALLIEGFGWQATDSPIVSTDREYLLVGDGASRFWTTYCDSPFPSQLLRRRMAANVGSTRHWDWRKEPSTEVMLESIRDLQS